MRFKRLRKGDQIALVAPASPLNGDPAAKIKIIGEYIASLGFRLTVFPSCLCCRGYLAGEDEVRANDLNRAFADPDCAAVLCVRGGYGSPRILDRLDYRRIGKNKKPLIGFSDITALHAALYRFCGMPGLHAAMPGPLLEHFDREGAELILRILCDGETVGYRCEPLRGHGTVRGTLVGGNLTLLCSLLGTPYFPPVRGNILFLEEVDEPPYRIDRMLNQLRLAGVFSSVRAVVLGDFPKEDKPPIPFRELVEELVCSRVILHRLSSGHTTPNVPLPLGTRVALDADSGVIEQVYPLVI